MADTVQVKLLKGKVIARSVWPKGSKPFVSAEQAKALVEAKEAEYVAKPAKGETSKDESGK